MPATKVLRLGWLAGHLGRWTSCLTRKSGYYTLPLLWSDQLVTRFDSKLDRTTGAFVILGFWLEDQALGEDEAFVHALAGGFARFVTFLVPRCWMQPPSVRRCCTGPG